MKKLRVLVGCEFSGVVRDAFAALGHDSWSCDLLSTESPGQHLQMDVVEAVEAHRPWDLLIHHWECTLLCYSGVRWLYGKGRKGEFRTIDQARWVAMENSAHMFKRLSTVAHIPKICGENPIPHKYARRIMGDYTQIIQPWQFGHGEVKATCLWLKGLPLLKPTNIVEGRIPRVHHASPGPDRWKERSRTLVGVGRAMAEQWSNL